MDWGRRVGLIFAAVLAMVAATACGTSRSTRHAHAVTPRALACGRIATPANFAAQLATARPGAVVCLASGDYRGFVGVSKPAPGLTITSAPGANVTFSSGIALDLSAVRNFTLDGMGGGGTLSVGGVLDMETRDGALQDQALNLTFENVNFLAGASVLIRGPENGNIVFDRDTFVAGNANCMNGGSPSGLSGIFNLLYSTATPTTPSGVTVENSVFVAPADLWNPYRAMQTGSPMTVEDNVFAGFLARSSAASCNHVDTLQLFGATPGAAGGVTFTGNLCYDDYGCIMAFDGTSDNTIADNVCFDIERSCVILYSDRGSHVSHNTQQTGGADPSRCATEAAQACMGSQLFENGHKPGETVSSRETYTNNIAGSAPTIGDPGSLVTSTNNMWPGASSPNINGSPSFAGGANPTTWAGFALRPSSAGHGGASDGHDVGIRLSAGGPPTGGGSPPVNQVPPALSGPAVRGRTLSTTDGTWAITGDVPTVTTYQWFDCPTSTFSTGACTPIQPQTFPTSANGPTYALQSSDVGRYVVCEVTVTNATGQVSAASRPVGPVRS